tara:strand:- start:1427 stop:1579 length:153 start_codon:yes stop_codon:yes gene_type:complete
MKECALDSGAFLAAQAEGARWVGWQLATGLKKLSERRGSVFEVIDGAIAH